MAIKTESNTLSQADFDGQYKNCFVCYFDLLGFKNLVNHGELWNVLDIYYVVLQKFLRDHKTKEAKKIHRVFFSDTFLLFSESDSIEEFAAILPIATNFFQSLIINQIPVRGAMTHGQLYAEPVRNTFFGKALIDAYEFAENQKGLGLLLTPSLYDRLLDSELDLRKRLQFRKVESGKNVFAFSFNWHVREGTNPFLERIRNMKDRALQDNFNYEQMKKIEEKYNYTENFILRHSGSFPEQQ